MVWVSPWFRAQYILRAPETIAAINVKMVRKRRRRGGEGREGGYAAVIATAIRCQVLSWALAVRYEI